MTKEPRRYTQTVRTADEEAIQINRLFNDVTRMIRIGKMLIDVRAERFDGDIKAFRKWARMNLDKDEKSCFRYMIMAKCELTLDAGNLIKLTDAYHLLDLDGSVEPERVPNTYTIN